MLVLKCVWEKGSIASHPKLTLLLFISDSVIIDFGFAKYVPAPSKTFTLCGTPLYLPPEVILNRGHNSSADHWSLGVLIYEMLTGDTPFYKPGMEQMDLFRAIIKCRYSLFLVKSPVARTVISAFLTREPAKRLGSLAGGEDDVAEHPWFEKIDFDELRQKTVKPPKIPKIKNPLDASNFSDCTHLEDKTKVKYPKVPSAKAQLFVAF
jgi:serine/threonine protein kinase